MPKGNATVAAFKCNFVKGKLSASSPVLMAKSSVETNPTWVAKLLKDGEKNVYLEAFGNNLQRLRAALGEVVTA